ncbi:MAG: D-alanyl-D-alanine carboxypeptidase family protein [Thermodesulfobacteriota bacterium]
MSRPKYIALISLFLFVFIVISGSAARSSDLIVITESAKHRPQGSSGAAVSRNTSFVITPDPDNKTRAASRSCHISSPASLSSLTGSISAKSAIIKDGISGRTLYAHNPDLERQPASTIKILTALISLQNLKDRDWVYISSRASGMPRSKLYLNPGKSYYAKDLIKGLLISSANDAGVALGEKIAGSEWGFAKMMTNKARKLGAYHTVCKSATGLTCCGQKSTVRDLATIFDKAMEHPDFASIMRKEKAYTSFGKMLTNHNKALWRVRGATAGKTGYTDAARQTYVGQFKRNDKEIIVAIMGSETMWHDIGKMVEAGFRIWGDDLAPAAAPAILVSNKKQRPSGSGEEATEKALARLITELRSEKSSVISGSKKYPYM